MQRFKKLIRNLRKGNYREKPSIPKVMDSIEGREGGNESQPEPELESPDR
jgi:hypothetical protein